MADIIILNHLYIQRIILCLIIYQGMRITPSDFKLKKMGKKTKRNILLVLVFVCLLNKCSVKCLFGIYDKTFSGDFEEIDANGVCERGVYYLNWLRYKDDVQEYVRNSDSNHFWSDPSICCMANSLDYLEYKTDSVKVDSMLVVLLNFRDKNGVIQGNDIHRATIWHIKGTRRKHLLPYIQQLRDSFDSYPSDMKFDTERSYGREVENRNIKGEIDKEIEGW